MLSRAFILVSLTLLYSCVVFLLFPIKAQVTVTLQVAGFMFCVGFCVALRFYGVGFLPLFFHTEMSQLKVLLCSPKRSLSCRSLSGNTELRSSVSLHTRPPPPLGLCSRCRRSPSPALSLSVCLRVVCPPELSPLSPPSLAPLTNIQSLLRVDPTL